MSEFPHDQHPSTKWKTIFIALLVLAIACFALRVGYYLKLGFFVSDSNYGTPRRLRSLKLLSEIAPLFYTSALAIWGANKIYRLNIVSPRFFSKFLIGLGTLMAIKFGLDLLRTTEYANSISDYKFDFLNFTHLSIQFVILWLLSRDIKNPFILSPMQERQENTKEDIKVSSNGHTLGRNLLIVFAAISFLALLIFYTFFLNLGSAANAEQTNAKKAVDIFYQFSRAFTVATPSCLMLWFAHSLKPFSMPTLGILRKFITFLIPLLTIAMIIRPALQLYSNRDNLAEWLFGKYSQGFNMALGFTSSLIYILLLVIMAGALKTYMNNQPTQGVERA